MQLINKLLKQAGRAERVYTLEQCNGDLVYSLYSELLAEQVSVKPVGTYIVVVAFIIIIIIILLLLY